MDIFEDDSEEMMLRLVEMVNLEERTDLEKTVDPTEEDQNCTHYSGEADLSDDDLDKKFEKGCGCKKRKDNKLCCTLFNKEDYQNHRDDCRELTCKELDLVILAKWNQTQSTAGLPPNELEPPRNFTTNTMSSARKHFLHFTE